MGLEIESEPLDSSARTAKDLSLYKLLRNWLQSHQSTSVVGYVYVRYDTFISNQCVGLLLVIWIAHSLKNTAIVIKL